MKFQRVKLFCKDRPHLDEAIAYLKPHCEELLIYKGARQESFPEEALVGEQDLVISYISSWIIPKEVLSNTKHWAINFHPGPPEYPGTGCTNFALYDDATTYGVTSHLMEATVDTGAIIGVNRFPVDPTDTVKSLTLKSYDSLFELYREMIDHIVANDLIPETSEKWRKKPTTRKELDALCVIEPTMSEDEVRRRVRATYYPGMPGPHMILHGYPFHYREESDE